MKLIKRGILIAAILQVGTVFAGPCSLSNLSIVNHTPGPLTWSAGIDSGSMAGITSTMKENSAQPIEPGHQINISLYDDIPGVKGYVNVYDDDDQLIATLLINFSNEHKGCKLSRGYQNLAKNYSISYLPDQINMSVISSKIPVNLTYCINKH